MEHEKYIDESWKDSVKNEKETLGDVKAGSPRQDPCKEVVDQAEPAPMEVNFINYITSLAFQTLIFLGEIPNPVSEDKIDVNLPQAKFLIDTLILIREKTKGNLIKEEENLLNASIYELQIKYVEKSQKEGVVGSDR